MATDQNPLVFRQAEHPKALLTAVPLYVTNYGAAYACDSRTTLKELPSDSVNLVCTSPPYALHFPKEYGNVSKNQYVDWFKPFALEIYRVLRNDGSFVLNIGGSYNKGIPTRSVYHLKLLIALIEDCGFHLAQEFFWYNPAKMPMPAEWVTVRRIRVKDSVEHLWWLSKTPWPKANNRRVLKPYSPDMIRLNKRGVRATVRPSGHNITDNFNNIDAGGAIPSNVFLEEEASDMLVFGNNAANDQYTRLCKEANIKPHPARFPSAIPDFFIRLLTDEDDIVLDPFAGSNTTGSIAESHRRRWLALEQSEEYLSASRYRFSVSDST